MSPNELLRAAAARARKLDAAATPGPWELAHATDTDAVGIYGPCSTPFGGPGGVRCMCDGEIVMIQYAGDEHGIKLDDADGQLIAAARSMLGPLADLLDAISSHNEQCRARLLDEALAVARALLGPEGDHAQT